MSEIYNFTGKNTKPSWFNHFMLGANIDDITKLTDLKDYDTSNLEVKLTINGVDLRIEQFNALLDKWSDDIEKQIKDDLNYLQSEQAVLHKAEQLIKDKLGNIQNILIDVENNLWKLSQD